MVGVGGIMCYIMLYSPWTRIIGKLLRKALLTAVKSHIPGNGFFTESRDGRLVNGWKTA